MLAQSLQSISQHFQHINIWMNMLQLKRWFIHLSTNQLQQSPHIFWEMSFLMDSQNVEREDPVFLKLFQKCCKVFQLNQSMYLVKNIRIREIPTRKMCLKRKFPYTVHKKTFSWNFSISPHIWIFTDFFLPYDFVAIKVYCSTLKLISASISYDNVRLQD